MTIQEHVAIIKTEAAEAVGLPSAIQQATEQKQMLENLSSIISLHDVYHFYFCFVSGLDWDTAESPLPGANKTGLSNVCQTILDVAERKGHLHTAEVIAANKWRKPHGIYFSTPNGEDLYPLSELAAELIDKYISGIYTIHSNAHQEILTNVQEEIKKISFPKAAAAFDNLVATLDRYNRIVDMADSIEAELNPAKELDDADASLRRAPAHAR